MIEEYSSLLHEVEAQIAAERPSVQTVLSRLGALPSFQSQRFAAIVSRRLIPGAAKPAGQQKRLLLTLRDLATVEMLTRYLVEGKAEFDPPPAASYSYETWLAFVNDVIVNCPADGAAFAALMCIENPTDRYFENPKAYPDYPTRVNMDACFRHFFERITAKSNPITPSTILAYSDAGALSIMLNGWAQIQTSAIGLNLHRIGERLEERVNYVRALCPQTFRKLQKAVQQNPSALQKLTANMVKAGHLEAYFKTFVDTLNHEDTSGTKAFLSPRIQLRAAEVRSGLIEDAAGRLRCMYVGPDMQEGTYWLYVNMSTPDGEVYYRRFRAVMGNFSGKNLIDDISK